jgi:hypothetical protein
MIYAIRKLLRNFKKKTNDILRNFLYKINLFLIYRYHIIFSFVRVF